MSEQCVFKGDSHLSQSERRRKKRRSRWGPQEAAAPADVVPPPADVVTPQLGHPGVVVNPQLGPPGVVANPTLGEPTMSIGEYSLHSYYVIETWVLCPAYYDTST